MTSDMLYCYIETISHVATNSVFCVIAKNILRSVDISSEKMAFNTTIIGRACVIEYHQLLDMLMKAIVSYGAGCGKETPWI